MSKRDAILLLDDMLQSAQKIKRYLKGHDYNSFLSDDKTIEFFKRKYMRKKIIIDSCSKFQ